MIQFLEIDCAPESLFEDERFKRHFSHKDFDPSVIDVTYAVIVDGIERGFIFVQSISAIEVSPHIYLYESAVFIGRKIAKEFIAFLFDQYKELIRVSAYVIEGNRTALNFVKKIGFQFEGVLRAACPRENSLEDIHIFSILRDEHGFYS